MATLTARLAFDAPTTILAATLVLLPLRAFAQSEAPAAADTAAPAEEAPKAEAPAEAAKPAEAPKCECPPPCPPPPAPPPAPPADAVEWKVQSKGGMNITSGNSQSKNFTFGVNGSRKQGNNKVALEGGLAYGTSNVSVANNVDATTDPAHPTLTEPPDREQAVSANNWAAKGRYDRFVTDNNAAYASGQAAADKIAGKTFFGGGQVGYSRQLLKDQWNTLVAELGYDFSYERYVQQPNKVLDPVTIHSARILVGETLSLSKETGVTASVEALFNLNKETKASNASDGTTGVKAFKDTRVNAKVGLSTNLWKQLSFGFSFVLKYDQNPAARPVPKGAPPDTAYPSTYVSWAYADKVDTVTEATFIYTFF